MPYGYEGVYAIHGPAGCGKTTRIARTVARILAMCGGQIDKDSSPVVVVSLTKAAAKEAAGRRTGLPKGAISTLHSVGYRSMGCPPVVGAKAIAAWNRAHPGYAISPRQFLRTDRRDPDDDLDLADSRDDLPGDDFFREYDLLRHRMVPREKWPLRVRQFAHLWEDWKRAEGLIDFTDMIALGGAHPLDPGVIIADEAQDLSALEHAYLRHLCGMHGAALILVGDSQQAIYTWRGADPDLLHDPTIPPDHIDRLEQSYRVPAAPLRRGAALISQIPGHRPIPVLPRREQPDDPASPFVEGEVRRCDATWKWPEEAIDLTVELARSGKHVLLATATNRMTGPMCAVLRERAIPFDNPWRRKERRWNPLHTLAADGARALLFPIGVPWTHAQVAAWTAPLREGELLRKGAKAEIRELARGKAGGRSVTERSMHRWLEPAMLAPFLGLVNRRRQEGGLADEILAAWLELMPAAKRQARDYVARVVAAHGADALVQEPLIHPSTIHACKGGEADHVFLFPDLSHAAMDAWLDGGEGRASIVRTFYVGITRTREVLHICEPGGRRYVEL